MHINIQGWLFKNGQRKLSASNPVPASALPNIHEEATQSIQGGAPSEHYHLTATELADMQALLVAPSYVLMFDGTGEIMFDSAGEPVYVLAS